MRRTHLALAAFLFPLLALSLSFLRNDHAKQYASSPQQNLKFFSSAPIGDATKSEGHNSIPSMPADDIRRELVRLQAEINGLKSTLASLNHLDGRDDDSAENVESKFEWPEEPTQEQIAEFRDAAEKRQLEDQARYDQFKDSLESRFAQENSDPIWASEKSGAIKAAVASLAKTEHPGFGTRSLECRSSTCRLEMDFDSPGARSEFEMPFMFSLGSALPTVTVSEQSQGESVTVIYFLRGAPNQKS